MASCDRLVWLPGSCVVPVDVCRLALRLEASGFTFRLAADGSLEVAPFDRLTPEDLAELRRWKHHIAMVLRHTPDDSHLYDCADVDRFIEARKRA